MSDANTNDGVIYLDYAATTPIHEDVADAVREAMLTLAGNASSQHSLGRTARRVWEDARERIVELLGGDVTQGDRLLITSGGSESNNHALRGGMPHGRAGHLITSTVEHPSIAAIAKRLAVEGHAVDYLPASSSGVVDIRSLAERLRPETSLVSLMLGNSETGVLQPVEQLVEHLAAGVADQPIAVHTDATQAVGRQRIEFRRLGVAMMTFAAHKFQGPAGVGGLLVRGDCRPHPLLAGQADDERPGTPPVALVVGMQRALERAVANLDQRIAHLRALRDRFESTLLHQIPAAVVLGGGAPRLPHTSCVAFCGQDRQALLMALDRAGVACSSGSACASGSSEPSPVLMAMGLPAEQIRGALRFSMGDPTTAAEVDAAVARMVDVLAHFEAK